MQDLKRHLKHNVSQSDINTVKEMFSCEGVSAPVVVFFCNLNICNFWAEKKNKHMN